LKNLKNEYCYYLKRDLNINKVLIKFQLKLLQLIMYYFITISLFIVYILMVSICSYTIIHILRSRERYVTKLNVFLNVSTLSVGIIYSTLFLLSISFYFSDYINLVIFKHAAIYGFIALIIAALIYGFFLEYRRVSVIPFLLFTTLSGLLLGSIFTGDMVQIQTNLSNSEPHLVFDSSQINYIFNLYTGTIIIMFLISVLLYFFTISFLVHNSSRNKEASKGLIINTGIFTIPNILYFCYIIFQLPIFRDVHLLLIWLNIITTCIMLRKKPDIFLVITNKIHSINIYHKSGVLLYSYIFEENGTSSAIWGNILIGLNHILSEFIDKKDQIDVMQTKNYSIIVNYENDLGYALVAITNHKNPVLKTLMDKFTQEFNKKYNDDLMEIQDLNKLINASDFADVKEMVEKNFHIYIK